MIDRHTLHRRITAEDFIEVGSMRWKLWVARMFKNSPSHTLLRERLFWRLRQGRSIYARPFGRAGQGHAKRWRGRAEE